MWLRETEREQARAHVRACVLAWHGRVVAKPYLQETNVIEKKWIKNFLVVLRMTYWVVDCVRAVASGRVG